MDIIEKTKEYFYEIFESHDDIFSLRSHLPEVEKWAKKILIDHPEADPEIVLVSVWLHDISHYSGDKNTDHAERSEVIARRFLIEQNYAADRMERILHCVRAHRNRDVQPETIEAKIIACADSASHMTDIAYLVIIKTGRFEYTKTKIERDYADLAIFPEIQKKLTPLYKDWKKLVDDYERLDLVEPIAPSKSKPGFN